MADFKNCNEYWEQVVEDYIEASCGEVDATKKDIKDIAQKLLDNDYIWDNIYSEIFNLLKERGCFKCQ